MIALKMKYEREAYLVMSSRNGGPIVNYLLTKRPKCSGRCMMTDDRKTRSKPL